MNYQRGKRAVGLGPWFTPVESVKVAEIWRDFESNHYTLAQLVMQGRNRKQIAKALGWSLQSVNHVLNAYRRDLRSEGIRRDPLHERIFRRATYEPGTVAYREQDQRKRERDAERNATT